MQFVPQPTVCALLLATACAHQVASTPPSNDARSQRWEQWAGRVEALPVCLPPEWDAAQREVSSVLPGDLVHVRGQLSLHQVDCSGELNELVIRGVWLPDPAALYSLPALDDAVARVERALCGTALGVRVGLTELAVEPVLSARVWRANDGEVFEELLSQTEAIVVGVVEAGRDRQFVVRPDRVCRAPAPPLRLQRPQDDGIRWKLLDGLELLANMPTLSRVRRAQALRVLHDVSFQTDRPRAIKAAQRLADEFSDRSRLGRTPPH